METLRLDVVQNLSLLDRGVRAALTAVLLLVPMILIGVFHASYQWWHGISWLASIYFGLTACMGWDPFYGAAGIKTCDLSDRNQCGTLPYQVDAAIGRHPHPKVEFNHSLGDSAHVPQHCEPAQGEIVKRRVVVRRQTR